MSPSNELLYVSLQLTALAEATPAEKFSWRPEPEARSTSEIYMHIVTANFGLLNVIGVDSPVDMSENMEKTVTAKADVIMWLKRSLDAVKTALAAATPEDMKRKVENPEPDATVFGIFLRVIIHANEHRGQLVAYARMTGVVPPPLQS
jgi:uncharacterized damage-inducible protein DinB